ncbi:MAG: helix-turn-helix domain-containing protein [Pseudomonadota bacterium]
MNERTGKGVEMGAEQWQGELYIGFAFALFRGLAGDNAPHRHYAAQCAYGETTEVAIARADGTFSRGRFLHVPSETVHCLQASDQVVRLLYYEPAMARDQPLETLFAALAAPDWQNFDWASLFGLPPRGDGRVRRALVWLDKAMDEALGATQMARAVGLSRNRFMALWAAEIGVPVRRYILWRRLKLAAMAIAGGATLTSAAHAAGFADSAHFARTMKAMFGVTATDSLQRLNIVLL